jgi:hypothetical protein
MTDCLRDTPGGEAGGGASNSSRNLLETGVLRALRDAKRIWIPLSSSSRSRNEDVSDAKAELSSFVRCVYLASGRGRLVEERFTVSALVKSGSSMRFLLPSSSSGVSFDFGDGSSETKPLVCCLYIYSQGSYHLALLH